MFAHLTSKPAIAVFFSYAHEDEDLRKELEKHLSILRRTGVITTWHDREIGAGRVWADRIDQHLQIAQIILLLISADFLASDYCYGVEMTIALARHEAGEATVIPVMLRPADWEGAPFGEIQWLPEGDDPVTTWPNRDEAFRSVAKGIRKAVNELLRKEEQKTKDLLERALSDQTSADALSRRIAEDAHKQQVERWRILKETQDKISQIQTEINSGQAAPRDEMYKKWAEYIKS